MLADEIRAMSELWRQTDDNSLFPCVLRQNDPNYKVICHHFKVIGAVAARSLLDDRVFNLPLSKTFWDILLERPVTRKSIEPLNKHLFQILHDLQN